MIIDKNLMNMNINLINRKWNITQRINPQILPHNHKLIFFFLIYIACLIIIENTSQSWTMNGCCPTWSLYTEARTDDGWIYALWLFVLKIFIKQVRQKCVNSFKYVATECICWSRHQLQILLNLQLPSIEVMQSSSETLIRMSNFRLPLIHVK